MSAGDVLLFSHEAYVKRIAKIVHTTKAPRLAKSLYDGDTESKLFSFFTHIKQTHTPVPDVCRWAGFQPSYKVVRGIHVLDEQRSKRVFNHLKLRTAESPRKASERQRALLQHLRVADELREQARRCEQSALRKFLLLKEPICAICGNEFPKDLLVAAHVKPRGKCNYAERRDLSNIVLMCKLGCDPLFERGYIVVKEGEIRVGKRSNLQPAPEYIQRLVGRTTPEYSAANAKYFGWKTKTVD